MNLSEIRKTVEKLREQPISLPDKNMALYPVPTVMYLAQHAIDLAAENERLKAKAKHYVCVRERNRETINDLKGKLNAAESENERLKAKLNEIRAECNKPITITSNVFGGGVSCGYNILKQAVLGIIDRDGDEP